MRNCIKLLKEAIKTNNSLVCCGIDPDMCKMPTEIRNRYDQSSDSITSFCREVVDIVANHVCAFKIQKAFFDSFNDGHRMLGIVINYIHKFYPNIPVILDCKIGDIDNTMEAYLSNVFDLLQADAVVVNPYMGDEVMEPFARLPNKGAVVLVRTSNLGATLVQDSIMETGIPFWMHILMLAVNRWNKAGNIIPVLASTVESDFSTLRGKLIPEDMLILYAGYGMQGGSLAQLKSLLNLEKEGVFINSSREILYPYSIDSNDWRKKIEMSVLNMKHRINIERSR